MQDRSLTELLSNFRKISDFQVLWENSWKEIRRQYQLMHYLKDNTIEMYDIKNRRKFLNRTRLAQMPEKLLIGTKLSIHARQHCIVDYADHKTRQVQWYAGIRPPPIGAGIRPFLSGLYYHPGKIFDFF